jgi:hypothetical protein
VCTQKKQEIGGCCLTQHCEELNEADHFFKGIFPFPCKWLFLSGQGHVPIPWGRGGAGMTFTDDIHPHVQSSHLALPKKYENLRYSLRYHCNILIIFAVHLRKVLCLGFFHVSNLYIYVREKRLLIDLDFIIAEMIKILIIRW